MPLDQALKDLMITSGAYQNVASRDVYGKRVGGDSIAFNCHLTLTRSDLYDTENASRVAFSGSIIMDGVYDIQKNAILTIEGLSLKATRVTTYFDEFASHHTSVEFSG